MRQLKSFLAGTVLFALSVAPVWAEGIDAANPQSVVTALQDLGYRAVLKTSQTTKNPLIESSIDASPYIIFFYGCKAGANCRYLHFARGFKGTPFTIEKANEWNEKKILGKAFISPAGDPNIRYFVSTVGGLSAANFKSVVGIWAVTLVEFKKFIGVK